MSRADALEGVRGALPDVARDIKLNLQSVLATSSLSQELTWGVAVASAIAARHPGLIAAVASDARARVSEAVIEDALAAASLMAMNNVYYRFRHQIGKPVYSEKHARLRMNRLARPATSPQAFELYCLAASAINGCEACVRAHERSVLRSGITEDQVHDAVRIAATLQAAAVALEAADAVPGRALESPAPAA
jgi:alkyl hydroperoxide reductase subunit D